MTGTYQLKLNGRTVPLVFNLWAMKLFCKYEDIGIDQLNQRLFLSYLKDPGKAAIEFQKPIEQRQAVEVDTDKFLDIIANLVRAGAEDSEGELTLKQAYNLIDEAGGINSPVWPEVIQAVMSYVVPKQQAGEEKKSQSQRKKGK